MKRLFWTICVQLLCTSIAPAGWGISMANDYSLNDTATTRDQSAASMITEPDSFSSIRLYSVYLSSSNVFDSNIDHIDGGRSSQGVVFGMGMHYQSSISHPLFQLKYEAAIHHYATTNGWDRMSHDLIISLNPPLGLPWNMETLGEISLKGTSEDRELSDRYTLMERLEYRVDRWNRIFGYGAFRLKRFDDDYGRGGSNPYLGFKFENRLSRVYQWAVGYRYENYDAREPRHRYIRWTYSLEYDAKFSDRDELAMVAKYLPQRYRDRLVKVDRLQVPRFDYRWILEASWVHTLLQPLELELDYKYETRSSFDLDKQFNANLISIGATYQW